MALVSHKDAPELFGVGRTTFANLKRYDPEFPIVKGVIGRQFAYDLIELADYMAKKFPEKSGTPGLIMALEETLGRKPQ